MIHGEGCGSDLPGSGGSGEAVRRCMSGLGVSVNRRCMRRICVFGLCGEGVVSIWFFSRVCILASLLVLGGLCVCRW